MFTKRKDIYQYQFIWCIMPELETLSKTKPSVFSYTGSIKNGTIIIFGTKNSKIEIKADVYSNLLEHFRGSTVMAGTSHNIKKDNNLKKSIGYWLYVDTNGPKLSGSVVTSYICSILTHEGFCKSFTDGNRIMIRFLSEYSI